MIEVTREIDIFTSNVYCRNYSFRYESNKLFLKHCFFYKDVRKILADVYNLFPSS